MITIECSRCEATAQIGLDGTSAWTPLAHSAVAAWASPSESVVAVILPEGWTPTRIGSGDLVLRCPEHAG